jgi:hypothetical protein
VNEDELHNDSAPRCFALSYVLSVAFRIWMRGV